MSGQLAEQQPVSSAIAGFVDQTIGTVREAVPATAVREEREPMPLPTEPRTIFLGGLFFLASLTALYVASPIILPVVLAIVLKLLLQPFVRITDRVGVPRSIGSVLAIALLVMALAALVSCVAGVAVAGGIAGLINWGQSLNVA